jgi:hypothetical protein
LSKHNYSQYSSNKKTPTGNNSDDKSTLIVDDLVPETKKVVDAAKPPEPTIVRETVDTVKLPKTVTGVVANCTKLNMRVAPVVDAEIVTVTGVVANCTKLNMRVAPVVDAEIVTVIEAGTKVFIDVAKSTDEWFSVRIGNNSEGYNGYCMKKFIDARL